MEGIQVSVEKVGANQDIAVIKVGGYIDTTTSGELENSLSSVLKSDCYNIVIDLANVDYISSAGWGIFISEIKGIREKGGDLKLIRMIPDVYEVFELLEFHHILKAFGSLDEAINDFNDGRSDNEFSDEASYEAHENDDQVRVVNRAKTDVMDEQHQGKGEARGLDSIEDKIRQIVYENPDYGTIQIMKTLNTPRFGNVKVGWFRTRKLLKTLNLDSKKKRQEYFQSRMSG